jgi:acyl-CoA thioester hydrolase
MLAAETTITAQFYDLDPMGVVWHGNYPRFLEHARCALLERIDYDYTRMRESGYAWPIVDMRIKYVRPICMAEVIVVRARLIEFEHRLKLEYRIRRRDDGEILTKAETVQVAVHLATGEMQLESPAVLIEKVRAASCDGG